MCSLGCAELYNHTAAGAYGCAQPRAGSTIPMPLRFTALSERELALCRYPRESISISPATARAVNASPFRAIPLSTTVEVQTPTRSDYVLYLDRLYAGVNFLPHCTIGPTRTHGQPITLWIETFSR